METTATESFRLASATAIAARRPAPPPPTRSTSWDEVSTEIEARPPLAGPLQWGRQGLRSSVWTEILAQCHPPVQRPPSTADDGVPGEALRPVAAGLRVGRRSAGRDAGRYVGDVDRPLAEPASLGSSPASRRRLLLSSSLHPLVEAVAGLEALHHRLLHRGAAILHGPGPSQNRTRPLLGARS